MKLTRIKSGTYKGQYEDEIGVIYNQELALARFPECFTKPEPKRKSAKK